MHNGEARGLCGVLGPRGSRAVTVKGQASPKPRGFNNFRNNFFKGVSVKYVKSN